MANNHHLEQVITTRMAIPHHTRMPLELVQLPALGGKAFEVGLEHAVGHRTFQPHWAGSVQNALHQLELRFRHGLGPRLVRLAHITPFSQIIRLRFQSILPDITARRTATTLCNEKGKAYALPLQPNGSGCRCQ